MQAGKTRSKYDYGTDYNQIFRSLFIILLHEHSFLFIFSLLSIDGLMTFSILTLFCSPDMGAYDIMRLLDAEIVRTSYTESADCFGSFFFFFPTFYWT